MELSERWMQKFETEGFQNVYEWQDPPERKYDEHANQGPVSIFVTDGSITFHFEDEKKEIKQNERFDIPQNKLYSAIVGSTGSILIVGKEIDSDFSQN